MAFAMIGKKQFSQTVSARNRKQVYARIARRSDEKHFLGLMFLIDYPEVFLKKFVNRTSNKLFIHMQKHPEKIFSFVLN